MTETETREWIRGLVHRTVAERNAKIAATTPAQAIAMLDEIIGRSEPKTWTEQEITDMGTLAFVADWIKQKEHSGVDKNKRIANDPEIRRILAPYNGKYERVGETNQWYFSFPGMIGPKELEEVQQKVQARVEEIEKEMGT